MTEQNDDDQHSALDVLLAQEDAAFQDRHDRPAPPVAGEITDAAVKDVAAAIEAAYRRGCINWNSEALAAITAARPHLAGPLVEEVARLRAELAAVDRDLLARLAAADLQWSDETGDEPSSPDYLRHLADTATSLRSPDPGPPAETPATADEDEIDEFHPDYCPAELSFDNRHSPEYFKRGFLCAWCHADPDAVLAGPPAPTGPPEFTITAAPPSVAAVMDLVSRGGLGYLAPSQEWVDDHGDPLPDDQQDGADYLQRAGLLHEFDEWFPAEPATPSAPEGDQQP